MRMSAQRKVFSGLVLCLLASGAAAQVVVVAQPVQPIAMTTPAIERTGFHVLGGNLENLCPNQDPPFYHWDMREFPGCEVPYEINASLATDPAAAIAAIHEAAGKWSGERPSHLRLEDMTGWWPVPCPIDTQRDDRNCFTWTPNLDPSLGGLTTHYVDAATGILLEVDIELNSNVQWQGSPPVCGTTEPFGVETVMIHEIGHFLGLAHPNQFDRPGCGDDDPNMETRMYSQYTDACNIDLHPSDWDGINFLYTADLGDHDDPPYPSRIHSGQASGRVLSGVFVELPDDGPEHLFGLFESPMTSNNPRYQYEWLGLGDEGNGIDDHELECETRAATGDVDNFDDGAILVGSCTGNSLDLDPTLFVGVRTSADVRGRSHVYNAARPMYINAWFDWNSDGDFQDGGEHVLGGGTGGGFVVTQPGTYAFQLANIPSSARCDVHYRVRLDYREDVGRAPAAVEPTLILERGAAQHGEVEDYVGVFDPNANMDPNRPTGPSVPIAPWSPIYCHMGMTVVSFGPGAVTAKGFCHPPKIWKVPNTGFAEIYPKEGSECMDTTLSFEVDYDNDGLYDEAIGMAGPVCVTRSDPYYDSDGYRTIDTEMVSLDMTGYSPTAGEIKIRLADKPRTFGQIRQTDEALEEGVDVSYTAPSFSFFEVYFVMEAEELGESDVVGPIEVTAFIGTVPPGPPNGTSPTEPQPVPIDDAVVFEDGE